MLEFAELDFDANPVQVFTVLRDAALVLKSDLVEIEPYSDVAKNCCLVALDNRDVLASVSLLLNACSRTHVRVLLPEPVDDVALLSTLLESARVQAERQGFLHRRGKRIGFLMNTRADDA